jgi:hypothetical protein
MLMKSDLLKRLMTTTNEGKVIYGLIVGGPIGAAAGYLGSKIDEINPKLRDAEENKKLALKKLKEMRHG